MTRLGRIRALIAAVVILVGLGSAMTAAAHVSIEPPIAQHGGFATVVFRVPNERSDAATTRIRVQLPPEHPMASVLVRPVPGWTVNLEKAAPSAGQQGNIIETVTVISWEGGRIEPGFYESFEVTMGPLPEDADLLYFPTIQYYEDGTEVPWIERPSTDGSDPEEPAPELRLVDSVAGSRDAHGEIVVDQASTATASEQGGGSSDDSSSATTIASLSLGIALVALVTAAVFGFMLARRKGT
jgi:uncharacterized protein